MVSNKNIKAGFFTRCMSAYLSMSLWFMVFGLLIRVFEMFITYHYTDMALSKLFSYHCEGVAYDILTYCKFSAVLVPLFLLVSLLKEKAGEWFLRILLTLVMLTSLAMVIFYSISGVPLSRVFFLMTFDELIHTIGASEQTVWWGYLFLVLLPTAFFFVSRIKIRAGKVISFAFMALVIASLFVKVSVKRFNNNEHYYAAVNKYFYIYHSIVDNITLGNTAPNTSDAKKMETFRSFFPNLNFDNDNAPFYHDAQYKDVLSPFMELSDEKPNIVIVLVEGLANYISGKYAEVPSVTPYLDSLSATGLRWDHCFSGSIRTYGVLPTVLGALPTGKLGFMSYRNNCPDYHSLLKILHQNGYYSSFFYGGWLCFDDMCFFLQQNQVDNYLNEDDYDDCPLKTNWGLYDDFMFEEALKSIEGKKSPRVDVFLTLTTHDPFDYPNKEKHIETLRNNIKEREMPEDILTKKEYEKVASYLYLDESLRKLMNLYSQRDDFENTIFIFTGDHDFSQGATRMVTSECLVPLVIWSPMITRPKEMPAVATHRDLTPSLLSLLKRNYAIETPDKVSWLNTALDTSSVFRANSFTPMAGGGKNVDCIVYKEHYIEANRARAITCENGKIVLKEEDYSKDLKDLFSIYRYLDIYVMYNDALIGNNSPKSNTVLLETIDDDDQEYRFLSNTYQGEMVEFEGKTVFKSSSPWPVTFIKENMTDDGGVYVVESDFDIFVSSPSAPDTLHPVIKSVLSIDSPQGESVFWGCSDNLFEHLHYNTWEHLSIREIVRKEMTPFNEDDILKVYMYNPNNDTVHISNFRLKAKKLY